MTGEYPTLRQLASSTIGVRKPVSTMKGRLSPSIARWRFSGSQEYPWVPNAPMSCVAYAYSESQNVARLTRSPEPLTRIHSYGDHCKDQRAEQRCEDQ